jgi:predicted kinase
MLPMSRLILMIGIPGSGKSSLAQQLIAQCPHWRLISTDAIRAQLFGDEAVQGSWPLIWSEVERQFRLAVGPILKNAPGKPVRTAIYDATNAVRQQRRAAIEQARAAGFTHITGLWLDVPVGLCLERNQQRRRQVPEEVILQMHRHLCDAPPALPDGLDRLFRHTAIVERRVASLQLGI